MIDKFFYITILIILLFFRPNRSEDFNEVLNLSFSIVYVFLLVFFLIRQRMTNKNWLRFDVIFLVGFTFVHFEIPFLASIGINPENPSFIWPNQQVVNFATWMSLFSITLWMLGYSFFKNRKHYIKYEWDNFDISLNLYDITLFIALAIFLLMVGPSLFRGEYAGASIWGEGAVYPFLVLKNMLNLRIIYFIATFKKKFKTKNLINYFLRNKIFFIVLFLYIFLFLLSGKRGSIMQVALVAAGAYVIFINRISFLKLTVFLFAGALLFTILSLGRGVGEKVTDTESIFTRGYSAYQQDKDKSLTEDLSSTVRIQYMALDNVPDKHPYLYGITFVTTIASIIPLAGGLLVNTFNIPKMYQGSANFFTIVNRGPNPTSGDGSEILADLYINFGIYGVFILMFFFGLFSKSIYKRALSKDMVYVLVYLVLIYSALTINRGSLLSPIQDIAYILFFHFFFTRIIKKNKKHIN